MSEYRDMSFNPELLKIEHFKHYPQMIPFVGKNYKDTRLLIIAESHYLPPKTKDFDPEKFFADWYDYGKNPIPETWYNNGNPEPVNLKKQVESFNSENYENKEYPKENYYCWVDYTWTAKIVAAVEWNNGGHRIYKVLRTSLNDVLKNNIANLEDCAFMNFFQRPAKESGKSIQHDKDDIKVAGDTLQAVCEILKPAKLFFVSSRAYGAFCAYINNKENQLKWEGSKNSCNAIQMIGSFNNVIIGHGAHPGCSWWNRKSKNYTKKNGGYNNTGKEAFEYFISDNFKF